MKSKKDIKVAYIGQVAPFEPEFYNEPGYGRPGSLAQLGFIEALHNADVGLDRAWGFRPISHWPRSNVLFERTRHEKLDCGATITLLPLINILGLKEISRFFIIFCVLLMWTLKTFGQKRVLVMYNISHPNGVVFMRLCTWLFRIKLVPIVYDLSLIVGWEKPLFIKITEPKWLDRLHERFMPLCDGLIPITDAIHRDFAPRLPFLRVDGGVGASVIKRLPELCPKEIDDEFAIMYAGGMEDWNHVPLMFEFMEKNRDPRLRLWLAGGGSMEAQYRERASRDDRISYFGFLSPEELYSKYAKADVLLNLRDNSNPGLKYHFPSKTFEMLAMGKPVVISNSSHTREAYGEYCRVVDECTLENLQTAIEFFLGMSPTDRLEYGRRSREFTIRERSWRSWGPKLGELIITVANDCKKQ